MDSQMLYNICPVVYYHWDQNLLYTTLGGRRGRDYMVVGFITTYAISVYHH